jgi:hypothetical protein
VVGSGESGVVAIKGFNDFIHSRQARKGIANLFVAISGGISSAVAMRGHPPFLRLKEQDVLVGPAVVRVDDPGGGALVVEEVEANEKSTEGLGASMKSLRNLV